MTFFIKNMVCPRCITAVETIFTELNLQPVTVRLGEVEALKEELPPKETTLLALKLKEAGFELIDTPCNILVNQIKSLLIQLSENTELLGQIKLSAYLSKNLLRDYSTLSNLFSSHEHQTIEHYLIQLKIERAKELLSYKQLSLSQIAEKLGYSSVSHLSTQFKKMTGISPSVYKHNMPLPRVGLDQI